jgi:hypothetical protein
MIPRIVYIGESVKATALFCNEQGGAVMPKNPAIYPIWRILDHQGDFVLGGIGTYDDNSCLYLANFRMPDYAEISASYSNPSQDTSNQAQRPYMIEWEIVDTFGKQWNYRETFEVGNPLFTSEIKEQQKINELELKINREKQKLHKKLTRQKILLGAFLVDALENDSVEGLKEYTADNLINFLTRQTDKDLMADLVKGLGSTVKTKTDSDSSQGNQLG